MEDKLDLHLQDPALPPILLPTHEISRKRSVRSLMTTLMLLAETRHRAPCFHPTSFLNPGYGVLFQHIGRLHQNVYKTLLSGCFKNTTYSQYAPRHRKNGTKDVKKVYLFLRNIMKIRHSKPF